MKFGYLCAIWLMCMVCSSVSGQTARIRKLEKERKQALQEIENTNKLLSETKKTTKALTARISLISNQIASRKQVVDLLGKEVNALSTQQEITQQEIQTLEVLLKEKQDSYAKAIDQIIYRKQNGNRLLYILSGRSLGEVVRRLHFLKDFSDWRAKEADAIRDKSLLLQQKKADLQQQRKSKILLINEKDAESKRLQKEEENYQKEASDIQSKQKELQSILQQKTRQANELNEQISKLIAEEVARQQREAQRRAEEQARKLAAEKKARQREEARAKQKAEREERNRKLSEQRNRKQQADNKIVIKQTEATEPETDERQSERLLSEAKSIDNNLSRNFASNKGRLPVPVTGRYSIVSGFGMHHQGKHVTTNSNGIDIQTQAGANARAVFGGEVSRIVAFPGFNTCVIIRHGNYYTFYGNIQNVQVRQGQSVKTGQSIGRVFTDPDSGITKLHFQLWYGTNKQNPKPWLRK